MPHFISGIETQADSYRHYEGQQHQRQQQQYYDEDDETTDDGSSSMLETSMSLLQISTVNNDHNNQTSSNVDNGNSKNNRNNSNHNHNDSNAYGHNEERNNGDDTMRDHFSSRTSSVHNTHNNDISYGMYSSSIEEKIERQPMIESYNTMDQKEGHSPFIRNETNFQHHQDEQGRTMYESNNHNDIGPNERLYMDTYFDIINRIIGKNDPCGYEKINGPTDSTELLDDRISLLYTQLEEEGVDDLLLRLEANERMSIDPSYDNNERNISGTEEKTEMKDDYDNDNDKDHNDVNERDFSSALANSERNKNGDKQPNCETVQSLRPHEEGGGDNDGDMSEIIEFDNPSDRCSHNLKSHDFTNTGQQDDLGNFEPNNEDECINEYNNHEDDSTVSSIELARKSKKTNTQQLLSNNIPTMFQSPSSNTSKLQKSYKKRLATTSGKKGTDLRRLKTNRDSNLGFEDVHVPHRHDVDHDGFEFTRDYDHCADRVDGIMNATTHYNPMEHSPLNDNANRMSFLDSALNSQSPILRRKSLDSPISDNVNRSIMSSPDVALRSTKHSNRKFSPHQQDVSGLNDSIESVDSNNMQNDESVQSYRNDDEIDSEDDNLDVTLRDDSNFYLDPLEVYRPSRQATSHHAKSKTKSKRGKNKKTKEMKTNRRSKNIVEKAKAIPTCTYMEDPFREFGSRTAGRLDVVLEWLLDHDTFVEASQMSNNAIEECSTVSRAVVISIPFKQIMSLVLCTMMKNGVHQIPRQSRPLQPSRNRSSNVTGERQIFGGTLIVARSKEDVAEWLCSLREKTSFSVLNHCEISSAERRRVTILSKCTGYDIVLTTHDALKAKEATATVDECGRVIRQTNSQGAWLSSKSNNSQNESQHSCKVLCRLHSIEWTRVIFNDILGRVSYLTKPGTARMEAATALKAKSRYVSIESFIHQTC